MDLICIKLIAPFALKNISANGEITVPDGTRLRKLLRLAGVPLYGLVMPVVVNGKFESKSYRLQDGDLVVFVMPFRGG